MAGFSIRNDVGATVFSILSGISILFLTAWMFSPGGCAGPKETPISPVPTVAEDDETAQKLADANAELEAEAARRAELALKLREAEAAYQKLQIEQEALISAEAKASAKASKLTASLSDKKGGLAGLAALQAQVSKLTAEKKTLTAQIAESPSADMDALEAELAGAKKKLAALQTEIDKLKAEKAELTSAGKKLPDLEAQVKKLTADNKALSTQLAEMKGGDAKADEGELAELKKQLAAERKACNEAKAALTAEIDALQKKLDEALYGEELKAAGDFPALDLPYLVNDPLQLNRKVRPVFIALRGMTEEADEVQKVYEELTRDGKASALHNVPFESGSAYVASADTQKLNELLKDSPKGARYLVVGYASTDGNAKSNFELSSKRASNVAATLAEIKGVDQDSIQAVYFGQTKRFNAAEMAPNRIVEVWRVK